MDAITLITEEEGFKADMYQDHLGNWTIGHGITNMTEEESAAVVQIRIDRSADRLRDTYEWFHRLNETRQAVIISMVFQLGFASFRKFKKTIGYLENGDFVAAAVEAKDSKAYKQTTNRWKRQLKMLREGS